MDIFTNSILKEILLSCSNVSNRLFQRSRHCCHEETDAEIQTSILFKTAKLCS